MPCPKCHQFNTNAVNCHPPGPAMSRAQGLCRACIDPTPSAEGRHHWFLPWAIQWCRCCSGTKLASCLDKQFLFVSKINVRSLRKSLEWKSAPHSIQNWVYILGSGQGISDNRTVQVTFGSREFGFPATISFGEWQWFVIFILSVFAVTLEGVVGVGNMHSNKPEKLRYNLDKVMVVMISNEFQLYQWLDSHEKYQWLYYVIFPWLYPMVDQYPLWLVIFPWIPSPWYLKKNPWPMVP